ncbi:MAG: hypothetical protein ACHQYP_01825 [Nitrospiria bacterium]
MREKHACHLPLSFNGSGTWAWLRNEKRGAYSGINRSHTLRTIVIDENGRFKFDQWAI